MHGPTIIDTRLPDGVLGLADGDSTIWLDDRLLAADRRVVLEHELIHLERGHAGRCTARVERDVDTEVARRLVTLSALNDGARWSEHVVVIADELDVMPETIEGATIG